MTQTVTGSGLGIYNSSINLGAYGPKGSAALGQGGESVYVNAANGNLILRQSDGFLADLGFGLDLFQTYNSRGEGSSWCFNVNSRLELSGKANQEGSYLIRIAEDGHRSRFIWNASKQEYHPEEGGTARITWNSKGWTYHEGNSKTSIHYDSNGLLQEITDRDGHQFIFTYKNGQLASITDKSNKQNITWSFNKGMLTDVTTTSDGAVIHHLHYEYDEHQRLHKVTRDLGQGASYWVTYDYVGDSNLIRDIKQSDGTTLHIDYDAEGRVKQLTDGEGRITKYSYEKNHTTITNGLGEAWTYYYDEQNRLTGIDGPEHYKIRYHYEGTELRRITQGNQVWNFRYNEAGDCIYSSEPNGQITQRIYDANHQLLSQTQYQAFDGNHNPIHPKTTRYVYDNKGHLQFLVEANGTVTEYRYNTEGQLTSTRCYLHASYNVTNLHEEDLLNQDDLTAWVAQQNPQDISLIDYQYDWRGQLTEEIHYRTVDSQGIGNPENALITRTRYDAAGRLIEKSIPTTTGWNTTYYFYDDLGRLTQTIDNHGNPQNITYDDAHQCITQTDANGLITQRIYDRSGLLLSTIRLDAQRDYGTTTYRYDAAGRLVTETNAEGLSSYFFYDAQGRLHAKVSPQGQMTVYRYNDEGLLIQTHQYTKRINTTSWATKWPSLETIIPEGTNQDNISQILYNQYNQITYTIDAQGAVIAYTYDAEGHVISKTAYATRLENYHPENLINGEGLSLKTNKNDRNLFYYYDENGRLIAEVNGEGYATEYRYNHLGLLIETCKYFNLTHQYSGDWQQDRPDAKKADIHLYSLYDASGLKVADIDGMGYLTEYRYDLNGRVAERIAYESAISSSIFINENATLDSIRPETASNDHHTCYRYNELGQLTEETTQSGLITTYEYDEMGNLITKSRMDAKTHALRQQRIRYDALGRVIQQLDELGCMKLNQPNLSAAEIEALWKKHSIHYTYDNSGLLLSSTDALQRTTRYFYNEYQQLNYTVNDNGSVVETRYNALNQVESVCKYSAFLKGSLNGFTTQDLKARLQSLKNDDFDELTIYEYNSIGQVIAKHNGSHGLLESTYNVFGELEFSTQTISESRKKTTSYSYDRRGLLSEQIEDVGGLNRITATQYDAFGWVNKHIDGRTQEINYKLNKRGECIVITNANHKFKGITYDAFGRILTETDYAFKDVKNYTYDDQNNILTLKNPQINTQIVTQFNVFGDKITLTDANNNKTEFQYDERGLLTRVDAPEHSFKEYHYDEAGQLSWQSDAGSHKIEYTYDAQGHVLTKTIDPNGLKICTRYQYDAIGRQLQITEGSGLIKTFTYDNQGRLIQSCIDPKGLNLITTLSYDEQGLLLRQTEYNAQGKDKITAYEWDNLGRRSATIIDPDGLNLVTHYEYDQNDNLLCQTDANQHSTHYVYDANNQCRYQIDARGVVTEHVYSLNGNETQTITYANRIKSLSSYTEKNIKETLIKDRQHDQYQFRTFDSAGRVTCSYDALGYATVYDYDGNGNVINKTQYAHPVSLDTLIRGDMILPSKDGSRSNYFAYDGLNRLRFQCDMAGCITESQYDTTGQLISRTQYAHTITLSENTKYALDYFQEHIILDSQHDKTTRYAYDQAGRLSLEISPQGVVKSYQYNALNQVIVCTRYALLATPALGVSMSLEALQTSDYDRTNFFVYDAAGREIYRISAEGQVVERGYDDVGNVVSQITHQEKVAVKAHSLADLKTLLAEDQGARSSTYEYDAASRLLTETNAAKHETHYTYDQNGNVSTKTEANKAVWTYRYDEANQLIKTISPSVLISTPKGKERRAIISQMTYDSFGNLISETRDAEGIQQIRRYEYDAMNHRVKTIYPGVKVNAAGNTSSNQRQEITQDLSEENRYNAFGELIASSDKAGHWKHFAYDYQGHLLYSLDTKDGVTQYEYDTFGRVIKKTQYYNPVVLKQDKTYDLASISEFIQKDGCDRHETYDYNLDDQLTKRSRDVVRTYNAATGKYSLLNPATSFRYNAFGEVIQSQTQINETTVATTTTYYNKDGHQTAVIDAEGYLTTYTLTAFGEVDSMTEYATRASGWDADNYLAPQAQTKDRTVTFTYDALGQVTSKTLQKVSVSRIENHKVITEIKPLRTSYTYDALGHLTSTTDAQGNNSYCYYDELGQLIAKVGPKTQDGRAATTYTYDALGNLVETYQWANGARSASETDYKLNTASTTDTITRSQFDAQGLLLSQSDGMQHKIEYSYDANGNLARSFQTLTKADKSTLIQDKRYHYDSENHLIQTTSFKNNGFKRTEEVQYNIFGEVTAKGINNKLNTFVEYDHLGRVWRSNTEGYYQIYIYDLADHATQLVTSTNGFHPTRSDMGIDLSQGLSEYDTDLDKDLWSTLLQRQNNQYDTLGRLLAQSREYTAFDAKNHNQEYVAKVQQSQTLDRWGNMLTFTNALKHQTTYEYNDFNEVIQQELPEVSVMDEHGKTSRLKPTNYYYYDELGQAIALVDANGNLVTKSYDAAGHLIVETDAKHASRTKHYNLLNQLDYSINELKGKTTYTYDKNNRLTSISTPQTNKKYTYDEAGQLLTQTLGAEDTTTFEYDTLGNQIVRIDAHQRKTTYEYDDVGHKTKEIDGLKNKKTWVYDDQGRLKSHTDMGNRETTFEYNTNGLLIHESTKPINGNPAKNIRYYYQGDGQLIQYSDVTRNEDVVYTYDDEGQMLSKISSQSGAHSIDGWIRETDHYEYDELGRLVKVHRYNSDTSKEVNDLLHITYDYDKANNIRHTKVTANYKTTSTSEDYYTYDANNRMTTNKGQLVNGDIVITSKQGTKLGYDTAGNIIDANKYEKGVEQKYHYTYNNDNQLELIQLNQVNKQHKYYDATGRVIKEIGFDDKGKKVQINTMTYKDGDLFSQTTQDGEEKIISTTTYDYDAAGNLKSYSSKVNGGHQQAGGHTLTHSYTYELWDSYQQKEDNSSLQMNGHINYGKSERFYDSNGLLKQTKDTQNQNGQNNSNYYLNSSLDGIRGRLDKDGQTNYLTVAGKTIGDIKIFNSGEQELNIYGGFTPTGGSYQWQSTGQDMGNNKTPIQNQTNNTDATPPEAPQDNLGTYTLQAGDSMESIALQVYGDSSLWYLIADANGITSRSAIAGRDGSLQIGLRLTIPPVATGQHHANGTRRILDANKMIGDTSATTLMPTPKPPKPQSSSLLAKIVVGIIATVATVLTAGAIAPVMASLLTLASGTLSASAAALAGTASIMATGFSAGFVGNITGQVAAMALGMQEQIDVKSGLISGLATAATAGLGQALSNVTTIKNITKSLNELSINKGFSITSSFEMMEQNAASQGANVALRKHQSFDWEELGISGLTGGVIGSGAGKYLDKQLNRFDFGTNLLSKGLHALAGEGIGSTVLGTNFNTTQVIDNTISNTVNDIVDSSVNSAIKTSDASLVEDWMELMDDSSWDDTPTDRVLEHMDKAFNNYQARQLDNEEGLSLYEYSSSSETKAPSLSEKFGELSQSGTDKLCYPLSLKEDNSKEGIFDKIKDEKDPHLFFIMNLYPFAYAASKESGLSLELMLAQAALETLWGQQIHPGTNNLYNIKVGSNWDGGFYELNALEYNKDKSARKEPSKFRAYTNIEESVKDRIKVLRHNKDYSNLFNANVKGNTRLEAIELRKGGYATDPEYVEKLVATANGPTMKRTINSARKHYGY